MQADFIGTAARNVQVADAEAKVKAAQAAPTEKERELLERIADLETATKAPAEAQGPIVQVRRGITPAELEHWTTTYNKSARFLGMKNVRIEDGMVLGESKEGVPHRGYLVRSASTKEMSYVWTQLQTLAGYVSSSEFGDVYENMSADAGVEPYIHFYLQDGDE